MEIRKLDKAEGVYAPSLKEIAFILMLFSFSIVLVVNVGIISVYCFVFALVLTFTVSFIKAKRRLNRMIGHLSRGESYVEVMYYDRDYFLGRFLALIGYAILPLAVIGLAGIYVGLGIVLGFYSGLLVSRLWRIIRLKLWISQSGEIIVKRTESFNGSGAMVIKVSYKKAQRQPS
ncbi:MAG: hypothetical protein ACP5GO_04730 [Thermoprotei archaeon]